MKKLGSISAFIAFLLVFRTPCFAFQTSAPNSLALKGLEAVFVLVEELPRGATEIGLTAERIRSLTESKLRQAGISVPTFSYDDPYLYIRISVVGEAFSAEVSLREGVVLRRKPSMTCRAATWLDSVTGVHRGDGNVLLEGLQEVLDAFLDDYQQANPKKKPKEDREIDETLPERLEHLTCECVV